jgi:hypothetical protein
MVKKNEIVIPPKADIGISGKKAFIFTAIIFLLNVIINFISTIQTSWLDISIRAGITGIILGAINYIKHKYQ